MAAEARFQNAWNGFDFVLQFARMSVKRALGHIARQADDNGREQAQVDLVDDRLLGVARQPGLGEIDLFAHIAPGLVSVDVSFELGNHRGVTLCRHAGQFL